MVGIDGWYQWLVSMVGIDGWNKDDGNKIVSHSIIHSINMNWCRIDDPTPKIAKFTAGWVRIDGLVSMVGTMDCNEDDGNKIVSHSSSNNPLNKYELMLNRWSKIASI